MSNNNNYDQQVDIIANLKAGAKEGSKNLGKEFEMIEC